jgi:hypothetical protein
MKEGFVVPRLLFSHCNLVAAVKFRSSSGVFVVNITRDAVLSTTADKSLDLVQFMLCSLPFVSHFDIHLSRTQTCMPSDFPSIAQSVSVGNVLIISSSVFFVVNFSCASRVGDVHAQHRDVQTLIDNNILL